MHIYLSMMVIKTSLRNDTRYIPTRPLSALAARQLTDFPDALNSTTLHGQKGHGGRVRHGSGVARVSEQVKPKYMISIFTGYRST